MMLQFFKKKKTNSSPVKFCCAIFHFSHACTQTATQIQLYYHHRYKCTQTATHTDEQTDTVKNFPTPTQIERPRPSPWVPGLEIIQKNKFYNVISIRKKYNTIKFLLVAIERRSHEDHLFVGTFSVCIHKLP